MPEITWKQKFKLEADHALHRGLAGRVELGDDDVTILQRCGEVLACIRSYASDHPRALVEGGPPWTCYAEGCEAMAIAQYDGNHCCDAHYKGPV